MSTVVIQGPQSCLDSQLALSQKSHHMLQLDITTPSHNSNPTFEQAEGKRNHRSFAQALSTCVVPYPGDTPLSTSYAPPRTTMLSLSARSLQMCTENLGSESGCDIVASEDGIFTLFSSCPTPDITFWNDPLTVMGEVPKQRPRLTRRAATNRKQSNLCFPPPLTTIRGWESLKIRTHRESARVVMKAAVVSPERPYFLAERSHGRLRLYFYSLREVDTEEEEDSKELSSENEEIRKLEERVDDDDNEGEEEGQEEEGGGGGGGGGGEGEGECATCAREEMDVNSLEIGAEI